MLGTDKAPYACDSCRERKIGCSRERPKCENCKRWPGECIYSTRSRRAGVRKLATEGSSDVSLETRIRSLETLVQSLNHQVEHLTGLITQRSQDLPVSERSEQEDDQVAQAIRASHSQSTNTPPRGGMTPSSLFDRAEEDINNLELYSGGSFDLKDARDSLNDLSHTFKTGEPRDIKGQNQRQRFQHSSEVYIPSPQDASRLTGMFLKSIDIASPIFMRPPADVISKLALRPWEISESGWVLLYNCMVSTTVSLEEPANMALGEGLRRNTRLALDGASLFLEPSVVKVQALLALATHSFDFATPNMTCILIGQACQMAKLLGLDHLSTVERGIPTACAQSLFWSLYILDKEMSLAFGRSPFLPEESLSDAPRPDSLTLAAFNPHLPIHDNSTNQTSQIEHTSHEAFGANYFKAVFEFSMLISKGYRIQNRNEASHYSTSPDITQLISEVRDWKKTNLNRLRAINLTNREHDDLNAKHETRLAIEYLKFRYHHLLVFLTRRTDATRMICLTSARKALLLLDNLVSSSQGVYNGVIWILLYYPFVPFFSLFGNIIANPTSEDSTRDLELLRATVSFYTLMDKNHPHSNKLRNIADTFALIAERRILKSKDSGHLEQAARFPVRQSSTDTSGQKRTTAKGLPLVPRAVTAASEVPISIRDTSTVMKLVDSKTLMEVERPIDTYQAGPKEYSVPLATNMQLPATNQAAVLSNDLSSMEQQSFDWPDVSAMDVDGYMQFFEPNATNAALDCGFDWFSWDAYESTQSQESQMHY